MREMVGSDQCLQAESLRYLPWFGRRLCVMHLGSPQSHSRGGSYKELRVNLCSALQSHSDQVKAQLLLTITR